MSASCCRVPQNSCHPMERCSSPKQAQKPSSLRAELHFSVFGDNNKAHHKFSITKITFDKIWVHICIYSWWWEEIPKHSKLLDKIMFQTIVYAQRSRLIDEIDLFRENLFLSWNANWKSFISLDVFCVARASGEIYVDVLKQWRCKNVINSLIFLHASFRRRLDEHSVHKSHESSANHHSTIDNSVEITIIGSNSIPCPRFETTVTGGSMKQ